MAPNLKSMSKLAVFLGKFLLSLLEELCFLVIPRPRKNVAGEIVLITGAGGGLGRLLALQFARLGCVLVLWDINTEQNEETRRLVQEAGTTSVHAYTCDCSHREDVYRVASEVKKEVGEVSILINNAGVVTGKKFLTCPDDLMEKSFDVNFKAHVWTYKAFLPAMIANDHGHLVCISSSAGLIGVKGLADYCASKFAAIGFAESVFTETFAQNHKGIKTTIVCPFFIKTGMFEGCSTGCPLLLPILEPEYVVTRIVDAILQERMYLYIPKSLYFLMFLKRKSFASVLELPKLKREELNDRNEARRDTIETLNDCLPTELRTFLDSFLPLKMGMVLVDYLDVLNVMDGFIGSKKKD